MTTGKTTGKAKRRLDSSSPTAGTNLYGPHEPTPPWVRDMLRRKLYRWGAEDLIDVLGLEDESS